MSIQKKSLISALKTTKKANVASAPLADSAAGQTVTSAKKYVVAKKGVAPKQLIAGKNVGSFKKI